MKVLKDNNLITSRKDGNKVLYKLNHDVLDDVTSRLTLLSSSTAPCICETVEKVSVNDDDISNHNICININFCYMAT